MNYDETDSHTYYKILTKIRTQDSMTCQADKEIRLKCKIIQSRNYMILSGINHS